MTLRQAKDETAKKYGFTKWEYYLENSQYFDIAVIDDYFQKIVDLYCQSQKDKTEQNEESQHELWQEISEMLFGRKLLPSRIKRLKVQVHPNS